MANIIDALLVTLGLDTKDFKKGVEATTKDHEKLRKEAEKTAREMQEQGKKAGEFFSELAAKATELFAIVAGGHELKEFISENAEADRVTGRLAKMLGITTAEMDALQKAAFMSDASVAGFQQSIKGLAGNLVDIEKGLPRAKRALVVFQAAGITGLSKGKHVEVMGILDQLAGKMEKMNAFEAMRLGARMGLDEGTVRMLRQGRDKMAEVVEEMKKLGVATDEDVESSEKLEEAEKKLAMSKQAVGREIMRLLMPALTMLNEALLKVSQWAHEHPQVVKAAFIGMAVAAGILAAALLPVVIELLPIELIVIAIAAAVGLVAAGIAWVYMEWQKWTKGGKSDLGEIFAYFVMVWNQIKDNVEYVISFIKEIFSMWVKAMKDEFMMFFYIFTGQWGKALDKLKELWNDFKDIFSYIFKFIYFELLVFLFTMQNAWKVAWAQMKLDAVTVLDAVEKKLESFGFLGKVFSYGTGIHAAYESAGGGGGAGAEVPSAGHSLSGGYSMRSSHQTSSSRSVSIGEVTIQTQATDAQGIAGEIGPALNAHALIDHADGGMN